MGMFRFKGCDCEWEGRKSYEEIISIPKHLLDEEIDHMSMIGGSDWDGCRTYEEIVGIRGKKNVETVKLFALRRGDAYFTTVKGSDSKNMQSAHLWNTESEASIFKDKNKLSEYNVATLLFFHDPLDRIKNHGSNPYERYEQRSVLSGEDWV